ncbi:MAG TPA: hypothetical protein VN653_18595 [Anaerolineales bacterium]|nr:hypothetical protein [Anaerolineales bacterium]
MPRQFIRTVLTSFLIALLAFGGINMVSAAKPTPTPPPGPTPTPLPATPMQIFGAWHCGNHYCDWSLVRNMTEFDTANHWLIDRGDGRPSVNLVVLSFVNPLKMLNQTDTGLNNMIPIGMNQAVVDYFKDHGVRVMLSIGGITYTDDWDAALASNPAQLGLNAAAIAQALGVGIEIDYENSSSPNIPGVQAFINAYRSQLAYDATGNNHAARLTIDLGAGDRWLIALNRHATANWLTTANPVLDYANAMVSGSSSGSPTDWQEHVDGKPQYSPPVPPLAPAKFTGGLYLKGSMANCTNFSSSEQKTDANFVQTVAPNGAGVTAGMLGFMFWAAEYPSSRRGYVATIPPNTCEGGMGVAATIFNIPIPMPPLRSQ